MRSLVACAGRLPWHGARTGGAGRQHCARAHGLRAVLGHVGLLRGAGDRAVAHAFQGARPHRRGGAVGAAAPLPRAGRRARLQPRAVELMHRRRVAALLRAVQHERLPRSDAQSARVEEPARLPARMPLGRVQLVRTAKGALW
eukprot:7365868-Prymnesium_polylepis.1